MKAKKEEIIEEEAGELKRVETKGKSGVNGHGKYDKNGKLITNPKIVETVEDVKPGKKPEKKEEPKKPEFLVKDYINKTSNENTVLIYGLFNSKGSGVWQESKQLSAKNNDDLKKLVATIKKVIEEKLRRNPERFLNNTDLRMAIGSSVPGVYNGYPRGTFNGKEFDRVGKWALAIPDHHDHVHPSDLRKVDVGIEAKLCWGNGEKIVKSTFEDDIAVKDKYSKKTALFVVNVMKD